MAKTKPQKGPMLTDVYVLKVHFKDRPKVHRVIKMSADSTLEDLHFAIQGAIGWSADHMYAFYMSGKAYDDDTEYYPNCPEEDWPAHPGKDAKVVRLGSEGLALRQGSKFLYLFDFGDDHRFGIEVLEIQKDVQVSRKDLPMVVDSKGKAPEQY
jgi:hypothetical protein